MSENPHAQFDHAVMDLIEHSPGGIVPSTPAYQDALKRLYAAHQVYASADDKKGHVTARSLAKLPSFHASNLDDVMAGRLAPEALEPNAGIYDRYVQSLPAGLRNAAGNFRLLVAGRPEHHRVKHAGAAPAMRDPLHTLFLLPGTGPHPGLPGNYLYGSALELNADASHGAWAVHLHDCDDGVAVCDVPGMSAALEKLVEVIESAPFHMSELEALGFTLK